MQLLRAPVQGMVVPSERTINRILLRHGLAQPRPGSGPFGGLSISGVSPCQTGLRLELAGGLEPPTACLQGPGVLSAGVR